MRRFIVCGFGVAAVWSPLSVAAQTLSGEIYFVVKGTLSVTNPVVDVELWASFQPVPGTAEMFLGTAGRMQTSEVISLVNYYFPAGQLGSITSPPKGEKFLYNAGQIHFPPAVIGNQNNPFHLLTVSFTSSDLTTQRTIDLSTLTTGFTVGNFTTGFATQVPLSAVTEGSAKIHVVPSPAPLALLCLAPLLARRRRV